MPATAEPTPPDAADAQTPDNLRLHDLAPPVTDVHAEVRAGLTARPRRLSPKYFYDARGSQLFEQITELPEYYPTRTEIGIFSSHLGELAELMGRDALLVEYGSGSSRKIRLLLDGLRPQAYMPVDISRDHLIAAAGAIAAEHPGLDVHAVCADYSAPFTLPWRPDHAPVVGFFPGSSIGNFERHEAARFLAGVRETLGAGGRLLIGVDRRKPRAVLEAAYNDAAGVTAEFNRNILAHLRRLLGGDVNPQAFEHRAHYDETLGRIEMHLVAREDLRFRLGENEVVMQAGETLHTENSYKYDSVEFLELARDAAGFVPLGEFTDAQDWFSVFALEAA